MSLLNNMTDIKSRNFQTLLPFCVQDYSYYTYFLAKTQFLFKKSVAAVLNAL